MSQNQENPPIAGALMPPPPAAVEGPNNVPQPRQPNNLQGLLRYAMEAKDADSAASESEYLPMDEERRKFLEEVLLTMTMNLVDMMDKYIAVLVHADKVTPESDLTKFKEAFDFLLDHIDFVDVAIDFHKVGGFAIFPPCLTCPVAEIRANACSVLAECAQNNPYCQQVIMESDLLEHALALVERDPDPQVRVKALYAVSCSVRDNAEALAKFLELGALKTIVKVLRDGDEKVKCKSAFLLGSLATTEPQLRDELISLGIIPLLGALIARERDLAHEHLIALLWRLVENNPVAIDVCTQPELRLKHILANHFKLTEGKEEMMEEAENCHLLLQQLNQVLPDPPETDR